MKQQILSDIGSRLSVLGIPVQYGNDADITISTEFLAAGWSTGSKKISYEATVFANEQDNVVYMYEKTTEMGHGLSFGGSSGSSFQSGKTLFRKVKSIQYGPEGKAYECNLDFGAIPKAVQEAANQHGWKFKTVLNKTKAMYPPGVKHEHRIDQMNRAGQINQTAESFCSNCGIAIVQSTKFCENCGKPVEGQQQQNNNLQDVFHSQSKSHATKSKAETLGLIAFVFLGAVAAVLFAVMSVKPVGWIIGVVTLGVFVLLQKKLAAKGCFLSIVFWILTAFILLLVLALASPGSGV